MFIFPNLPLEISNEIHQFAEGQLKADHKTKYSAVMDELIESTEPIACLLADRKKFENACILTAELVDYEIEIHWNDDFNHWYIGGPMTDKKYANCYEYRKDASATKLGDWIKWLKKNKPTF